MLLFIILSLFIGSFNCAPQTKTTRKVITNPIVVTPLGTMRGTIFESRLGKTIYSFLGVPYAKPPVEELRFKVINDISTQMYILIILYIMFYSICCYFSICMVVAS